MMSTSILEALPGKPDIKRHSPSNFYFAGQRVALGSAVVKTKHFFRSHGGFLTYPIYNSM